MSEAFFFQTGKQLSALIGEQECDCESKVVKIGFDRKEIGCNLLDSSLKAKWSCRLNSVRGYLLIDCFHNDWSFFCVIV